MKRMRILGLALVAVFALGVVTAVSASASEPGWYECKKETGGKLEKGCGKEGGKGGYVLAPGVGKGKEAKGKGEVAILHNVIPGKGDIKVECKSFKDVLTPVAPNLVVKVVSTFSKCKSLGVPCQSGSKKETIVTESLAGELGYLSKSGPVVGVDLANEANPGAGYLAQFECTGVAKVRVFGSVIGEQKGDINVFSKTSVTKFAVGPYLGEVAPGYTPLVNPPEFEGGSPDILLTELNGPETGGKWEPEGGLPSGQEAEAANKGEDIEIKA